MLCKYKNSLGKPKEGVHSYRLFNIAIVDVLFTIIGAFLLSYFFNLPFVYVLLFLFLLGIVLHKLFCVETTIHKLLFNINN